MISYNEQTKTFYLETEKTSYIMRVLENGALCHCYYGAKIPQEDLRFRNLFKLISFAPLVTIEEKLTSPDTYPQECSTAGRGDFRLPSVVVETPENGCVNELVFKDYTITAGKPVFPGLPQLDADEAGADTLAVTLTDETNGFEAVLYYSVFEEENVITRRTVIRNRSGRTVTLHNAASFSLDIENADQHLELLTLEGSWGRERHIQQVPLHHGTSSIESRRGSSSHHMNPFAALVSQGTTEDSGEVYAAAMVYSGDFKLTAEVNQLSSVRFQGGINPETFRWQLAAGEQFVTPEAILTYSDEGLHGMSRAFHAACRNHLGKSADKTVRHPLVINSWEAMYFKITEEKFTDFIQDCKGLGIDTVVMDDGWFGARTNDASSLGDWFVNRSIFPNGLDGIIRCCHENGMQFGIWFEPEMISRNSELFRKHPDWCIRVPGMEPLESRNQLVLDMSRKEVCDAIYEQVAAILREYDISYVKWDMNRNITDNGSSALLPENQGELAHRYVLGIYDLMNRLVTDFPQVFFEGCSGGGGRFDFGILYYMPQIWTSDDSDPVERLKIQYGTSLVYPTSSMVAHVSASPNHQTLRTTPFDTRGDVAQICNYGYELKVGLLSDEEKEQIKQQTDLHKRLEPMVQNGELYRLRNPFTGNTCAWQLVSDDKKHAYVTYVRILVYPTYKTEYMRLKGLDEKTLYRVDGLDVTVSGRTLMQAGLPMTVRKTGDFRTLTFELTAVE